MINGRDRVTPFPIVISDRREYLRLLDRHHH